MFCRDLNNGDPSWMSQEISGNANLKCNICGIIFATQQEKEQHMKLEHQNKEELTGVA